MFVPSRKLVLSWVTFALTNAVSLVTARYGFHIPPSSPEAFEISNGIGIIAGVATGVIVKEVPEIEKDLGL